jgi:hypothetical protein
MIRLICRFTIASIVLILLLIITARAVGSTNKPPALAMLDPGNCPQPCWHGIQPGVTTMKQAHTILNNDPTLIDIRTPKEFGGCWRSISPALAIVCIGSGDNIGLKGLTYYVSQWPSQNSMQLGDAINLLGEPISTYSCPYIKGLKTTVPGPHWAVFVQFPPHIMAIAYKAEGTATSSNIPRISPEMIIHEMHSYPAA